MRRASSVLVFIVGLSCFASSQSRLVRTGTDAASGIEVSVASIPQLELSAVNYEPIPGGFKNLQYQLKNNSGKQIIAIEIWMEVSDGMKRTRTPQYMDWWTKQNLAMPATGSVPAPQGLSMASSGGGVRSISLAVGAIVFADGTTAGPDATDFRIFLTSNHQKLLERVSLVAQTLDSKGIAAARSFLDLPAPSMPEQSANAVLKEALDSGGVAALQAEIRRLSALRP